MPIMTMIIAQNELGLKLNKFSPQEVEWKKKEEEMKILVAVESIELNPSVAVEIKIRSSRMKKHSFFCPDETIIGWSRPSQAEPWRWSGPVWDETNSLAATLLLWTHR